MLKSFHVNGIPLFSYRWPINSCLLSLWLFLTRDGWEKWHTGDAEEPKSVAFRAETGSRERAAEPVFPSRFSVLRYSEEKRNQRI